MRPSNLYAADDGAREVAETLSRDAGYEPVFAGGLEQARVLEDAVGLFGAIRRAGGGPYFHRFAKPGELAQPRGHDRGQATPKAYWINTFRSVRDLRRLAEYIELAGPAMRAAGGRFLARGLPARVYEAGVMERTVAIEFDGVDEAVAAYESPPTRRRCGRLGTVRSETCASSRQLRKPPTPIVVA